MNFLKKIIFPCLMSSWIYGQDVVSVESKEWAAVLGESSSETDMPRVDGREFAQDWAAMQFFLTAATEKNYDEFMSKVHPDSGIRHLLTREKFDAAPMPTYFLGRINFLGGNHEWRCYLVTKFSFDKKKSGTALVVMLLDKTDYKIYSILDKRE